PYGVLPWYETGVSGLRLNKQGGDFVTVPLSEPKDSIRERHADVHMEEDGTVGGTIEISYLGAWGCTWREEDREDDDAGRKKDLENHIKKWLPGGATVEITSITGWEKT